MVRFKTLKVASAKQNLTHNEGVSGKIIKIAKKNKAMLLREAGACTVCPILQHCSIQMQCAFRKAGGTGIPPDLRRAFG
ncbi:MAG: hypothetical protein HPM95_20615 [Alphaproteobacteria bacterium]|nr:hypothetical protein [Alphaproteobacteria bacterium]